MRRKAVSEIMLTLLLIGSLTFVISFVTAGYVLVPNGSFESGTVGLIPDNWVMNTLDVGVENTTHIHEMQQTDQKYFEGGRSLWLHSRVVDTDGLKLGRFSRTIAETEDWINDPLATHVRIYIRDIKSTHSALGWGWGNSILLHINNVSVPKPYCAGRYWDYIFVHGETCNGNYYNYTAMGADGESWYVYEYKIPESIDKTHMKLQITCHASDWTFYSTSYFSDLEFVVDKVELLLAPPEYELTVTSSPITGITFTINGVPETTPYTEWLPEGSYRLVMPETHDGYVWSHWLEDGDTSRTKTITLPGTTWTGVFTSAPPPPPPPTVGGEMILIKVYKPPPLAPTHTHAWIGLVSAIISTVAVSVVYTKQRKRKQT